MSTHLVVGAGPVGTATARLLADQGHDVRLVSRRGLGPDHARVSRRSADASDAAALAPHAEGAVAVYNCVNPAYHQWVRDWPPVAAALLETAARAGAVLVTTSNLYGYGPVDRPMTEDLPLATSGTKGRVRAQMWADALAAHEAGRVRVTEARAADYFGPELRETSHLGRFAPRLLAGKGIAVLGNPDLPHSWTYVPDVARTLVTLASDERAWGRAWHVPSAPACTQRELVTRFCEIAGAPTPRVRRVPNLALRAAGVFMPMMRELQEVRYQFERPFVLDSTTFSATFGVDATPLDDALSDTAQWWRKQLSSPAARTTAAGTPAHA